jgi:hypothetical protein
VFEKGKTKPDLDLECLYVDALSPVGHPNSHTSMHRPPTTKSHFTMDGTIPMS